MGKKKNEDSHCCQNYGVPIYGAAWVPTKNIFKEKPIDDDQPEQEQENKSTPTSSWLVFCGGGGEGRSGIPNALVLAQFDPDSNSLSPNAMAKLGMGADLPYRMAVHPGGEGVICSFPKSCRWFEWNVPTYSKTDKLGLESSERVLIQLEDVGQQLAMAFSPDGSALAVGGEDGHLRIFKWPSMEVILDQTDDVNATVKHLNFSCDGKFIVSLGSRGPGRVWDVSSSKIVASLLKENGELFGFCQFSQSKNNSQILYITAMRDQGGSVVSWDTTSWKRIGSKQIVRDGISAFSVSNNGELLAIGTVQGDIYVVDSRMRVQNVIKKAHLGLVTVLMFSEDSRSLVSTSFDSSARVTIIENTKKQNGLSNLVVLFIVLLAILAYYLKSRGAI